MGVSDLVSKLVFDENSIKTSGVFTNGGIEIARQDDEISLLGEGGESAI